MSKILKQVTGGLFAVGLLTAICYRLHLTLAPAGFLYLLLVVIQSLTTGFVPAAVVSVGAVACLDYFFTLPVLSFRLADPLDVLALFTYLVTALVIGHLSSKVQREARTSERNEREMGLLYEAALQVLSVESESAATNFPSVFRKVFGLSCVCLQDAETKKLHTVGISAKGLPGKTEAAYLQNQNVDQPEQTVFIRCFQIDGKITGAIGFEGASLSASVAGSLSILAAMILERAYSFRRRAEAAAATEAETLRTAILDALAHEFKTPVAVALTAVEGIVDGGPLTATQREMAELIDTQLSRLERLSTRLLKTAQLDAAEIKPRMELTDLSAFIAELIGQNSRDSIHLAPSMHVAGGPVIANVDRDLLSLALLQLLENAFKYSRPGSPISIDVRAEDGCAVVRVSNRGSSIRPEERERIFERFYRGVSPGHTVAGTGLGLYVSRKIVLAHGGTLELDEERTAEDTVTFCMRLQIAQDRSDRVLRAG